MALLKHLSPLIVVIGVSYAFADNFAVQKPIKSKTVINKVAFDAAISPFQKENGSLILEVTLTNQSKKDLTWITINGTTELNIAVQNSKGDSPPLTRYGNALLQIFDIHGGKEHLAPGESRHWSVQIGKCYELIPGKYVLSASVKLLADPPFQIGVRHLLFEVPRSAR